MSRPVVYDQSLRIALIRAAADAIAGGGVESLSVRAVASTVGTSTSAIYAFFGSKSGLVEAVMAEAERSFGASQVASPVTGDAFADFTALGHAYRAWALANRSLYTVMFGGRLPFGGLAEPRRVTEGRPKQSAMQSDSAMSPLIQLIIRSIDAELIRPAPVEVVSLSVWAGVHGFVSLEIADGEQGTSQTMMDEAYAMHLSALLRGWAR